jgi:hypothetical protein
MVMRYHWGLAAGHEYAFRNATGNCSSPSQTAGDTTGWNDVELEVSLGDGGLIGQQPETGDAWDDPWDNEEFGFENRQDDVLGDSEESDDEVEQEMEDDEEFLAMEDMYYTT